jgi:hypothetical protein
MRAPIKRRLRVGSTSFAALILCMTTHAPSDAAPTPGRYVPANPGAVSRILKKAGLPRYSRGNRMGYSVSDNEVTLSTGYFNVFTESLDEMASVASVALRCAGYLRSR